MRSLFQSLLIFCLSEWYLFSYGLDIHSNSRKRSAYDAYYLIEKLISRNIVLQTRLVFAKTSRGGFFCGSMLRKVRNLYDCGYIPAWLKGAIHYRLAAVSSKAEIQIDASTWEILGVEYRVRVPFTRRPIRRCVQHRYTEFSKEPRESRARARVCVLCVRLLRCAKPLSTLYRPSPLLLHTMFQTYHTIVSCDSKHRDCLEIYLVQVKRYLREIDWN